ncbi:MAG: hypothetical protein RIS94_1821 [Pseudomonadota bacterium]|jgi:general secretion pathway protein M
MIAALLARYRMLTGREQRLVAGALGLTALVIAVYGLILPLGRAFDAAHMRMSDASERSARVQAVLAMIDGERGSAASMEPAPLDRLVAAEAEQADLVVQSSQPRGQAVTQVVVTGARSSAALPWLDRLARGGVVIDALTMTPGADGTLSITATLRRPAS